MQLKWLEDFVALAQERSFTRAAELRHVTHPAFGRRIRALESWAGTPLVERSGGPVKLTPAGEVFLDSAEQIVRTLEQSQEELRAAAGRQAHTITLATGRTLARTVVADWLVQLQPVLNQHELVVRTTSMQQAALMLEQGQADFSLLYHHPTLAPGLDTRQFHYLHIASDKLVPVARADATGVARYQFTGNSPVPYLAYARALALGRLVEDHLVNHRQAPRLHRLVECDSADAVHEYALKGLGVAWLPWSMVHADCKGGMLALAGGAAMEIRFDVRIYRPKRRLSPSVEDFWQALQPE